MKEKVVIIGAGLGGLCLAQGLRKAGLDFEVYERDAAAGARAQGYRLHIDADGVEALRDSLHDDLFGLFEATSMRPLPYTTLTDPAFVVRRRVPFDEYSGSDHHRTHGVAAHLNVNRSTLREILLLGLEGKVHFGESLESYEVAGDSVRARFASGREAIGAVLVGADGARSQVRSLRAPHARSMDTGLRSIYGRLPIASARSRLPGFAVADAFTLAADSRRFVMGLGPMVFPVPPQATRGLPLGGRLQAQEDYVAFILAGRHELFPAHLRAAGAPELHAAAATLLSEWPETSRRLVDAVDPSSLFYVEMFTSIPVALPRAPRVTLLGDAIHAMSPSLGRGANVALRDGALLARHLGRAAAGELSLEAALGSHEDEMIRYGFEVVRQSVETGARVLGQERLPESV